MEMFFFFFCLGKVLKRLYKWDKVFYFFVAYFPKQDETVNKKYIHVDIDADKFAI